MPKLLEVRGDSPRRWGRWAALRPRPSGRSLRPARGWRLDLSGGRAGKLLDPGSPKPGGRSRFSSARLALPGAACACSRAVCTPSGEPTPPGMPSKSRGLSRVTRVCRRRRPCPVCRSLWHQPPNFFPGQSPRETRARAEVGARWAGESSPQRCWRSANESGDANRRARSPRPGPGETRRARA